MYLKTSWTMPTNLQNAAMHRHPIFVMEKLLLMLASPKDELKMDIVQTLPTINMD